MLGKLLGIRQTIVGLRKRKRAHGTGLLVKTNRTIIGRDLDVVLSNRVYNVGPT